MPTAAQADRVVEATGCRRLPGKEPGSLSRRVDVGDSLQEDRPAIEPVSVLFQILERSGANAELQEMASGWTVSAVKFEVVWPQDRSVVLSHLGGRRFSYNWVVSKENVHEGIAVMRAAVFNGPGSVEVAERPGSGHLGADRFRRQDRAGLCVRIGPVVLAGRVRSCCRLHRTRVHRQRCGRRRPGRGGASLARRQHLGAGPRLRSFRRDPQVPAQPFRTSWPPAITPPPALG